MSGSKGSRFNLPRREFLKTASSLAAFSVLPAHVIGQGGNESPNNKLNIVGVGIGGMGRNYIDGVNSENIVALCDVDDNHASKTYQAYPKAKVYRDYKKMFDELGKDIDAVVIGTPDHTHATIAAQAMRMGKHVYCAKPLTRTVLEARKLAEIASETKVATQMSVQSDAEESQRILCEWIWAGAIGNVREVHIWSDRPIWPQGIDRPHDTPAVPDTLDWDKWLGPAPVRPYHPIYVPFKWRGWYDFGTGALGDMGCHSLVHVVKALKLGYPSSIHASSTRIFQETFPLGSTVHYQFPARGELPPVKLTWYDGGLKPERPEGLEDNRAFGSDGLILVGDKGTLLCGFTGGGPRLIPETRMKDFTRPQKTLPRSIGHYKEWVEACKGGKPAGCNFGIGTFVTEIVLLGNIALRTGKHLLWDGAGIKFTNEPEANNLLHYEYRNGWAL